jgi:hypothetical protein
MSKIDEIYDLLAKEHKQQITRKQFFRGILQIEMEKLRDMGLFNNIPLTPQETRDVIFNKLAINYNNLTPDGSNRCMHNYCRSRNIKASHVLPEAALRLICGTSGKQKNVLYTPIADIDGDHLKVVSLGVGKAFRFPGFCEKHENWFDFEKEKEIVSDTQAYKQVFRTICYDRFLQELFLNQEKLLSQLLLVKTREKITHMIRKHTILEIELASYQNFETKGMLRRLKQSVKRANLLLQEFRIFKRAVWRAARNDKRNVYLWQGQTSSRIPIAFSHCGGFTITNNDKTYGIFGAIILIPVASGSLILICTPKKYKPQINYLLKSFKEKGHLEHFILQALASLTDNWLVNPEFWDNELSETTKKEILAKRNWGSP